MCYVVQAANCELRRARGTGRSIASRPLGSGVTSRQFDCRQWRKFPEDAIARAVSPLAPIGPRSVPWRVCRIPSGYHENRAADSSSWSRVVDYYLKSTINAGTKWKWNVALHQFMSPNKIETNVDTYSKNLGQEVDIDFVLSIHKSVKVMGGYSFYITTPTIGLLKKVNEPKKLQNFAWLSIVVQPEILKF